MASILAERGEADLGGAIAEHQNLVRERKAGEARASASAGCAGATTRATKSSSSCTSRGRCRVELQAVAPGSQPAGQRPD